MNVSNSSLRRRQSSTVPSAFNRPLRRVPSKKRTRSSIGDLSASSSTGGNDEGATSFPSGKRSNATTKRGGAVAANNNNARQQQHHHKSPKNNKPLSGVVACLSGQSEEIKDRSHTIITRLGGTTMGRFDPRYVTHLILDAPTGSKYESWKYNHANAISSERPSSESAWAKELKVVTTEWVEACEGEGRRVDEEEYKLQEEDGQHLDARKRSSAAGGPRQQKMAHQQQVERTSLPKEIQHASLSEKCDWMIRHKPVDEYCNLFSRQSFILVGFDDENDHDNTDAAAISPKDNGDGKADGSRLPPSSGKKQQKESGSSKNDNDLGPFAIRKDEYGTVKGKISKLIRRAGGSIYWEPNESISVVLLNDNYPKNTWTDVRYFCREHPRGPICVDVDWILTCIYHRVRVALPPFPPEPEVRRRPPEITNVQKATALKRKARGGGGGGVGSGGTTSSVGSNSNTVSVAATAKVKSNKKKSKQSASSSVFRGDVFAIVSSKPNVAGGTLDFDSQEMESKITENGGLLLNKQLLAAIKTDAKSADSSNPDRKYIVVSSRWLQLDCATSYPILAELSKLGIKVVLVSSVWVAACIENNYKYYDEVDEYPVLFRPQAWPVRLLVEQPSSSKKKAKKKGGRPQQQRQKKFSISVTGFVDASRYGTMSMLKEIGAEVTESLTRKNTHLICKEARGQKYAKALEWGLHAVSIEWLYHVIRYGYEEGSEERFSFVVAEQPKKEEKPAKMQQQPDADSAKVEKVRSSLDNGEGDASSNNKRKDPKNEVDGLRQQQNQATDQEKSKRPITFTANGARVSASPNNNSVTCDTAVSKRSATESESEIATNANDRADDEKDDDPSSSQSSAHKRRRGKRDPPQSSPKDPPQRSTTKDDDAESAKQETAKQTELEKVEQERALAEERQKDPTKRLHFALQTLEAAPTVESMTYNSMTNRRTSPRRRGKRDKSPLPNMSQGSAMEDEEESPQAETQFTVGTIRANADVRIGGMAKKSFSDDSSEVPLSYANDAVENGESQVLWFAAPRL